MAKNKKNLKKIDSDQDGLSDFDEIHIFGTDPNDSDTDDDGMEDGEEVLMGRNPSGPGSLKDFFIPHKGNDYRPRSLHPKRIVFHLASAAVIKTIALVFILLFPMSAWLTPEMSAQQSKEIIALTNNLRKEKAIPELKENSLLNQTAFKKVQDMLIKEYFAHTSPENKNLDTWLNIIGYKYSIAGENLAMGFSVAGEVMEAWKKSPTHYANLIDKDFKEIGVAMSDGLFKGKETTLAAQYFARPEKMSEEIAKPAVKEPVKVISEPAKATVSVSEPVNKKERVVMAAAKLAPETEKAFLVMGEKKIELQKENGDTWTGSEVITNKEYKEISQPVVLASISATDSSGNETLADVSNQDIKPQEVSLADQYFLLKNHPNKNIRKVLLLSYSYFTFLLIVAFISLALNVFIEIKKQYPSLIWGGISLMTVLLIFLIV